MDNEKLVAQFTQTDVAVRQWIDEVAAEEERLWNENTVDSNDRNWFRARNDVWRLASIKIRPQSHELLFGPIDEICDLYLAASPEQRAEIRRAVKAIKASNALGDALYYYPMAAALQLQFTQDAQWLLKGLASVAINDFPYSHQQDLKARVYDLILTAMDLGVDAVAHLRTVAEIANSEPCGFPNYPPLKDYLFKLADYYASPEGITVSQNEIARRKALK